MDRPTAERMLKNINDNNLPGAYDGNGRFWFRAVLELFLAVS